MTCTSSTNPCVGLTMNPDLERRKELERRKKLRLLQVRQQSKEFADRLRERVKEEIIQQKKIYAESEKKLKQEKHLQELRNLKELYDRCLQSIGKGHKEAAEQPNVSEEKQAELARISTKASVRGAKATKKQVEEEVSLKKKIEAPVKQKKVTRNKENLRAFFISSLPKHVKNHKRHHSVSPPKSTHQNSVPLNTRRVLDEIPSNLRDYESRVSVLQNRISPEKPKSSGKEHCRKQTLPEVTEPTNKQEQDSVLSNVSSARECSCDYIVCSCHATPRKLRRCSSESRISNEKGSDFEEPRKKKLRSRSCSPTSVRTLNYFDCGNVYESNQKSFVRVTHHSRSPGETEEERKPNTEQEVSVSKPSIEDLKKRTEERCAKALRKEQLKRDFQQLIQNLKQLTREKSVINNKTKGKLRVFSSERDILTRNENKQRKLNDAFEKLSHCVKSTKTQNTQNTGVEKLHLIPVDDSSPPTLNLALYQANMPSRSHSPTLTRRVVSMEQITLESTAPTTISLGSKSVPKRTRSSGPKSTRSLSAAPGETVQVLSKPGVLVQTTEKGDVKIEVRVSEVTGRKQKSKSPSRSKSSTSHTSDSSYVSPPSNLTPSQQQLLDALLRQVNKNAIGAEMKNYIKKLLKMSRESIDQLRSSSSCQKICPSETESPGTDIERDLIKLGELAEVYAEKVNKLVDMHEQMSNSASSGGYVDVTRAPKSTPSSRGPTPSARSTPSPRPRSVRTPDVCPSPGQHTRTTPSPTSSGPPSPTSTADTDELLFGGFGGPPPPSDSQLAAVVAQHPELFGGLSPSEIEGYDDLVADFDERRKQILSRCESSSSEALNNGKGIDVCPFEDDFGGEQSGGGGFPFGDDFGGEQSSGGGFPFGDDFGGDCGEFLPSGEDWSNIGLTDEDFGAGIDTILQEEAISEGHVDYPSDFPPQTDVFGPGFEWDYANLVQPHFPSSFPGEPLGGHSMSSADDCVRLDTSFDMSALQGTLNPQRLIALRQKLSNICNDQYRGIIEMLQKETSQHQMQYGKLLEQATSDPFLDPNATLAPIGPVDSSYAGSEWTIPRDIRHPGTPSSPGFSRTGRTPPGELRVQGDFSLSSCAPSSQQSSGPTRGTSDLQTSAQFAEFEDDPFNSINNLMLLVRNQQVQNNQID